MAFFRRTEAELRAAPSETFTHDQIGVPGTSSQVVCTTCPSGAVPFVFTGVVTAQQVLDSLAGASGSAAAQRLALGRLQAKVRREQRRLGLPVDESGTMAELQQRLRLLQAGPSGVAPRLPLGPSGVAPRPLAPAPSGGTPLAPSGGGVFAVAPTPTPTGRTMADLRVNALSISDIGRVAGGALGGLAAGGPIGGILGGLGALGAGGGVAGGPAGGGTKFTGTPAPGDCFDRFGNRVPCPQTTTTTTDVGPFGGLFGGTSTTTQTTIDQIGGAGAMGMGVSCPKGFRPNKSSYTLRDGTFVPKGTRCVRNRRLNPMNGRANRRAISRIKSAKRMQKELSRITIRKKC